MMIGYIGSVCCQHSDVYEGGGDFMSKKRRKYTEIKLDDKIIEEMLIHIEEERQFFFLKKTEE